ncbi:MAG TPA: carboxypeptidase-like regulatory domain-containing protein, partial [Patescibacteria group bacterium]|nr:carboxypeptidase-like regulatory domain-containing protein [Patescibacteria group bacterium]
FLPIEGRPMDLMIGNYFKDLFTPTQYFYVRGGGHLAISLIQPHPPQAHHLPTTHEPSQTKLEQTRQLQLQKVLSQLSRHGKNQLDQKEDLFITALFNPNASPSILSELMDKTPSNHQLSEEEAIRVKMLHSPLDMEHELETEAAAIKNELAKARQQEQQLEKNHAPAQAVHTEVTSLEHQLQDVMAQKQQLEQELLQLKKQMENPTAIKPATLSTDKTLQTSQNVRIVPSDKARSVGLPSVADVPNVIVGIIKDPRGNVLPNILVEIKDKEDNPVRAFKTNGLGHFASATPLNNGTYTVTFEDPKGKQQFETVALEVKGEIMPPLEIISHDAREDLRKELFA